MTANEMAYRFTILYDKITNFAAPGYEDAEISRLLTISQENKVKRIYTPFGNKYNQGLENTEKRRTDLDELIRAYSVSATSTNQTGIHPNGVYYDLPNDFLWAIEERLETNIDLNTCDTLSTTLSGSQYNWKQIPIRPVTHDQYNLEVKNPFRKPDDTQAWRMSINRATVYTNPKRHEIITDGTYSIRQYIMRYIKRPVDIVVDNVITANQVNCELDESMHMEIVYEAVSLATGITNPETYEIKERERLKSE